MARMLAFRHLYTVIKSSSLLSSNSLVNVNSSNALLLARRTLFTAEYLGLDNFASQRSKVNSQFGHLKENLLTRLHTTLDGEGKIIFSEDLKNAIFLTENDQDLDTLKSLIKRYAAQTSDVKFSPYQFSPLVMRLLYLLEKPDLAYELMMSDDYQDFFYRIRTFWLCMCLMWKSERYQDILNLNERYHEKVQEIIPMGDITSVVIGACYKLNTPESYKYALEQVTARRESGTPVTTRAVFFFSALALKQNMPEIAIESINMAPTTRSTLYQGLKLMGLAELKRFDDAFYLLKSSINSERLAGKAFVLREAVDSISRHIEALNNDQLKNEWETIHQTLKESNMICEDSLEARLCKDRERFNFNDRGGRLFSSRNDNRDRLGPRNDNRDRFGLRNDYRDRPGSRMGFRPRESYGNNQKDGGDGRREFDRFDRPDYSRSYRQNYNNRYDRPDNNRYRAPDYDRYDRPDYDNQRSQRAGGRRFGDQSEEFD